MGGENLIILIFVNPAFYIHMDWDQVEYLSCAIALNE